MKKINIVFGSVYGSAQYVAETLDTALNDAGCQVQLWQPEHLSDFVPPEDELLLVVTSTTGDGDLPDNIAPWFIMMKDRAPYLPELHYAVIGLGDSSYDTFCGGGKQIDALLSELGAKRVGERLDIDACETMEPETEALQWLKKWLPLADSVSQQIG
ncbi:flavodoxin [Shewanella yunxiaonensis]|uniref:Flavodoxin n=1 Tax=Shewanella yunxiaonensis TaxID=2829809 RepID=A0ABX7YQ48_9GAMM|nr:MULTISPECIES: flavodoxin [Shewanella]MDF0534484.1 flavodoxin [Shewanella sp. A32]QUN04890.1 flavodoxin [Shewanella yunxiaonensis]